MANNNNEALFYKRIAIGCACVATLASGVALAMLLRQPRRPPQERYEEEENTKTKTKTAMSSRESTLPHSHTRKEGGPDSPLSSSLTSSESSSNCICSDTGTTVPPPPPPQVVNPTDVLSNTNEESSSRQQARTPLVSDLSLTQEDVQKAEQLFNELKARSNAAFQSGAFDTALEGYQNCLDVANAVGDSPQCAALIAQSLVVRGNVALVFLKQERFEDARMVATFLLQDDVHPIPDDLKVKVLYRRGLASKALGDATAALADLTAAIKFSPNQRNAAAEHEIAGLRKA